MDINEINVKAREALGRFIEDRLEMSAIADDDRFIIAVDGDGDVHVINVSVFTDTEGYLKGGDATRTEFEREMLAVLGTVWTDTAAVYLDRLDMLFKEGGLGVIRYNRNCFNPEVGA